MSLLDSVASRFTTVDLTYYLADIDQHLVPPFVLNLSSDVPRYMLGGSALSPFSSNTNLISSIVSIGMQLITSTLSS